MADNSFAAANRRIEDERRAKYCGTASVDVASLRFQNTTSPKSRKDNSESLKRIFQAERGCRREDSRHHAKAVVSQGALEAALADSGLAVADLLADNLPYPHLSLPHGVRLECIQGCDRLAAADEVLQAENKRWIVDLFLDDLSDELRRMLSEDYDYQKRPDDGEIYVKIREYQGIHGEENPFFARLWLGRLAVSENRRKNFDQLSRHRTLVKAFDDLLDIPALFVGFRLSVVHQLISMRCDEQNVFYLRRRIYKFWHDVCGGDLHTMRQIDRSTVEAVQGRAPGACKADHDELFEKIRGGYILGGFSQSQRDVIWSKMCTHSEKVLIPTLFTFFEDRKYLVSAANCLKRLVDVGTRDTIGGRLEDSFTDANQQGDRCIIQISSSAFGTIAGDTSTRIDFGLRQLWLAALRDHQDLPAELSKKDVLAKARATADGTTLYDLASLAYKMGFESRKIHEILKNAPDRHIAERALLTARKPGRYVYRDQEQCIQRMVDIFATAYTIQETEAHRDSEVGECAQFPRRQGIPNDQDHERDKASLFFPSMEQIGGDAQAKMSSLFIRKSMYSAYFGDPPSTAECVPCEEPDHPMGDRTSTPHADPHPDRVNLSLSMIRRELNSEPPSPSDAIDRYNVSSDLLAQESETARAHLERVRDLAAAEEVRIDEKRSALKLLVQEERERLARLEQIAEREREAQASLDELLQKLREQDRLSNTPALLEETADETVGSAAGADHVEETPSETQGIATLRRDKRGTQFAFERLLGNGGETAAVPSIGEEGSRERRVHIEFKEKRLNGDLRLTDALDIDPVDPSEVARVAGKYARKGFLLFDVHDNNLKAKECFKRVTGNGSNTVVLKAMSRATRSGAPEAKKMRDETLGRIEE